MSKLKLANNLKSMNFDELIHYGKIGLSQLIMNFYEEVLYNDRYTKIENIAKPKRIKEQYIEEILQKVADLNNKCDILETQMNKIFECFEKGKNDVTLDFSELNNFSKSSMFILFYYSYRAIFLRASINLISRLHILPKSEVLKSCIKDFALKIYSYWCKSSDIILSFKSSFEMWKAVDESALLSFLVASRMISNYTLIKIEDIIKQLQICKKVTALTRHLKITLAKNVFKSHIVRNLCRSFSLITVLVRMILLDFMQTYNVNEDVLCETIALKDPTKVSLVKSFLDHNSFLYSFLLKSSEESVYHNAVNNLLNTKEVINKFNMNINVGRDINLATDSSSHIGTNFANTKYLFETDDRQINSNANNISDFSNIGKETDFFKEQLTGLGSIEEFISNTDLDDLYSSFWNTHNSNDMDDLI